MKLKAEVRAHGGCRASEKKNTILSQGTLMDVRPFIQFFSDVSYEIAIPFQTFIIHR
jgi:hypothetical protein